MAQTVSAEDALRMRFAGDPQLAAAGDRLAYVLTAVDPSGHGYRHTIHELELNGPAGRGADTQVTEGVHPRFAAEGLAFLRGGQIWLRRTVGSERPASYLPGACGSFALSPDGRRAIAVVSVPRPPVALGPTDGLHHVTSLKFKLDGVGLWHDRRPQLFVVDLATGDTHRLTDEPHGADYPAWSPDGRRVAYVTADEDPDVGQVRRLVSVSLHGGVPATICHAVSLQDLSWSPDGQWLAFRAGWRAYTHAVSYYLYVAPAAGGPAEAVTADRDGYVDNTRVVSDAMWVPVPQGGVWSADSRALFFVTAQRGQNVVARVGIEDRAVRVLSGALGPHAASNIAYCPATGALVTSVSTPSIPLDIFTVPEGRRLTACNEWLSGVTLAPHERLTWTGEDGVEVDGWVLRPPGSDPGRRYPAVLEIHGGPYRQWGMSFQHELQLLAARGFVVFFPNPRGTQGYGQAFADAIVARWGELDYGDLMRGVDHLVSLGYVDPARIGVTGGSYGGYMTNWIVTHTRRFRAAVTDRSLSNLLSFMGTADVAFRSFEPSYGLVGRASDVAHMLAQSPITYVADCHTPLLILHQLADHTCPPEQAEQLYSALRRLGRPVEMVLFPGANHELTRSGDPTQRVQRLQWILGWFERYLTSSSHATAHRERSGR